MGSQSQTQLTEFHFSFSSTILSTLHVFGLQGNSMHGGLTWQLNILITGHSGRAAILRMPGASQSWPLHSKVPRSSSSLAESPISSRKGCVLQIWAVFQPLSSFLISHRRIPGPLHIIWGHWVLIYPGFAHAWGGTQTACCKDVFCKLNVIQDLGKCHQSKGISCTLVGCKSLAHIQAWPLSCLLLYLFWECYWESRS